MKQYELLCVLRGTLSEDEVTKVMDTVKETIQKFDGTVTNHKDMEKRRIAYPIKHIRYGYFHLLHFDAAPEKTPEIQAKLRIMPELLRALITLRSPGELALGQDVTIGNVIDEIVPRQKSRDRRDRKDDKPSSRKKEEAKDVSPEKKEEEQATPETPVAEAAPATDAVPAKESKKVSMEDIDKKLDEILQSDLDKV